MNQIAIQILSNVVELDLEKPELIRLVTKRFLDEGEIEMSILLCM